MVGVGWRKRSYFCAIYILAILGGVFANWIGTPDVGTAPPETWAACSSTA